MSLLKSSRQILFITPYPTGISPGQRFRFEQYLEKLTNSRSRVEIVSFLKFNSQLSEHRSNKGWILLTGFISRLGILLKFLPSDFIFIFREITPVGPPIFEWMATKIFKKKIIYDFDDAIWLTDKPDESWFEKKLRWRSKVASICKWSYKISAGNEYLANFARKYNPNVVVNPTTIDTERMHNPERYRNLKLHDSPLTIGWTGSHSTLKYLNLIEPVLGALEKKYPNINFLIIANQKPELNLKNLKFLPWNKETEIADLLQIDIGLMPLLDDDWTRGKCGFKALQFMALEIPTLASPVGVNQQIIDHGVNGFLCYNEADWLTQLEKLISNKPLRKEVGKAARQKIINHYSLLSNTSNFLSLFE